METDFHTLLTWLDNNGQSISEGDYLVLDLGRNCYV